MATPQTIRISQAGDTWRTETSDGARTRHRNRADALQTAILWAGLHRPATVILLEDGEEEVVASFAGPPADGRLG